jgi:hypothetical protein
MQAPIPRAPGRLYRPEASLRLRRKGPRPVNSSNNNNNKNNNEKFEKRKEKKFFIFLLHSARLGSTRLGRAVDHASAWA